MTTYIQTLLVPAYCPVHRRNCETVEIRDTGDDSVIKQTCIDVLREESK